MILYTSTQFTDALAPTLLGGNPTTGQDGYGASCQVSSGGEYTESGGLTVETSGIAVGNSLQGESAGDPIGPYHQIQSTRGDFSGEDSKFLTAFCNTADIDVPTWVSTVGLLNGEETDWDLAGSGAVGLHTPNLTDDVYTLIVPTSPLRQALNVRFGNSIVFHIPQNSLAVYAINANLNTSGGVTSGMTDAQASEKILGFGYGLILKSAGSTELYNQS